MIISKYSSLVFFERYGAKRKPSIVYTLPMKLMTLIPLAGLSESNPYRMRVDLKPMYSSISPVVGPATHSRQVVGFNFAQTVPISFW